MSPEAEAYYATITEVRSSIRGVVRNMVKRLGHDEVSNRMAAEEPHDPRSECDYMRYAWTGRGTGRRN